MNTNPLKRQRPSGFTLVELLIVMVIIGILAGLALPAINRAYVRGIQARGVEEISQLNQAIEAFKAKYGVYPPSRIRLRENTQYNLSDAFDAHSVRYLKRIWPNIQLQIATSGNPTTTTDPLFVWFHEDTDHDGIYELEGDECLVFFLGGIAELNSAGKIVLHGFADRPTNPSGIQDSSTPQTMQRAPQLFNFDGGRLFIRSSTMVSANIPTAAEDWPTSGATRPDKLPSYRSVNSQQNSPPIAYFSSYEGQGYRPNDMCYGSFWGEVDPLEGVAIHDYQILWPTLVIADRAETGSAPPYPYTETVPNPGAIAGTPTAVVKFLNPQSFQIIVPGADNLYGPGSQLPRDATLYQDDLLASGASYDNLSNVSGSQTVGEFNSSRANR